MFVEPSWLDFSNRTQFSYLPYVINTHPTHSLKVFKHKFYGWQNISSTPSLHYNNLLRNIFSSSEASKRVELNY